MENDRQVAGPVSSSDRPVLRPTPIDDPGFLPPKVTKYACSFCLDITIRSHRSSETWSLFWAGEVGKGSQVKPTFDEFSKIEYLADYDQKSVDK